MNRKNKSKCTQNGDNSCKKLCKSHQQSVSKLVGIRDHATHHFPVGMAINIFERQDLDLAERLIPDVFHDPVGHLIVADIHDPLCCSCDRDHDHHLLQNGIDTPEIHLSSPYDMVDDPSRENRQIQRQRYSHRRSKNGGCQIQPVPLYIP